MRIYMLDNLGDMVRIYGMHLGTLKAKIGDYSIYIDYKGREWMHIYCKVEDKYYLIPYIRGLSSGEEYLEYLKHI